METLFLLSLVLAAVGMPILAARDRDARRGLRRARWAMIVYSVVYVAGLLYVLPRIRG